MSSFLVGGVAVEFDDFTPSIMQRNIICNTIHSLLTQKNVLIESPEGSDRAFLIISAALSFQQYSNVIHVEPPMQIDIPTDNFPEKTISTNNKDNFQIIVICRTNEDISKLVHQTSKLKHKPKTLILQNINESCLNSQVKTADNPLFWCSSLCSMGECHFNQNSLKIENIQNFDIEEIKSACIDNMQCPYKLEKENIQNADIIFCKAETFFFSSEIERLGIRKDRNILIFEDLANIESILLNRLSLTMKSKDLDIFISNFSEENTLMKLFTKLKAILVDHSAEIGASDMECDAFSINQIFDEINLEETEWAKLKSLLDEIYTNNMTKDIIPYSIFSELFNLISSLTMAKSNPDPFLFDIYPSPNPGEDYFVLRVLSISPFFRSFTKTAHSIIFTANVLTPMDSLQRSLGVNFDLSFSGVHPFINDQNFSAFAINFTNDNVPLSSISENKESVYISFGKLVESQCQNIPDGIVLYTDNFFDLLQVWRKNNFTKKIKKYKPIFHQRQGDKYIDDYTYSISVGNGGFLMTSDIDDILNLTGKQLRCLFFFGIPKRDDRLAFLKKKFDQTLYPAENTLDYSEMNGLRNAYECADAIISQNGDFGCILFIDPRFSTLIDSAPKWIRQYSSKITAQSILTRQIKQFFQNIVEPEEIFHLSVDRRALFICASCEGQILTSTRITTIETFEIDKSGFLEIIGENGPKTVLPVSNKFSRTIHCNQDQIQWKEEDGIGYSPLVCSDCCKIVGAQVTIANSENENSLDEIWLVCDRIIAKDPPKKQQSLSQSIQKKSQTASQSPSKSQQKVKKQIPKGQTLIDWSNYVIE